MLIMQRRLQGTESHGQLLSAGFQTLYSQMFMQAMSYTLAADLQGEQKSLPGVGQSVQAGLRAIQLPLPWMLLMRNITGP